MTVVSRKSKHLWATTSAMSMCLASKTLCLISWNACRRFKPRQENLCISDAMVGSYVFFNYNI